MERLTQHPWSWLWGTVPAVALGAAILGLGAPAWIFVPVTWSAITLETLLTHHFDRQAGRRGR